MVPPISLCSLQAATTDIFKKFANKHHHHFLLRSRGRYSLRKRSRSRLHPCICCNFPPLGAALYLFWFSLRHFTFEPYLWALYLQNCSQCRLACCHSIDTRPPLHRCRFQILRARSSSLPLEELMGSFVFCSGE